MKSIVLAGLLAIYLSAGAPGQEPLPVKQYLEMLIQDPGRVPQFGEGMRVMDQVAGMPQSNVITVLPVIFEGLASDRETVRMQSALALHAVSLRTDGGALLRPRLDDVLALLQRNDVRLALTVPAVLERLEIPPTKYLPSVWSYVADGSQPAQGKTGSICLLTRVAPSAEQTHWAIAAFLDRQISTQERIEALSAIGCVPADDDKLMDLIINALNDPDQHVRGAALSVLDRYRAKDLARAREPLSRIALDQNEDANVRRAAERLLTKK